MSKKILGNSPRGKLFVVSAPAGTGKTTLVDMLLKEFPDSVVESCSSTTRRPRPSEVPEQHYEFISEEEFERRIEADEFLEYAKVFSAYYGTRKKEVIKLEESGKHVVLVIDTQGALLVKQKMSAVLIFISPPSKEELRARLFRRKTEDDEAIEQRLAWAEQEMSMASHYDYHIVNDDLQLTYQILRSILIAEEHRAN